MKAFLRPEFEKVPVGEQASFAVREFRMPRFTRGWHFHPEYELMYIVQSRGKRFVGDSIAAFGPGDLVLVGANLPHYWRNDGPGRTPAAESHSIVIQFCERVLGEQPEVELARRLIARARRGIEFRGATRGVVAARMRRMLGLRGLESLIELLAIFKDLAEARESRLLASEGFEPCLDPRAGERIDRVHRYVFDHFAEPIYLGDAARVAAMSPAPFCRYFKKVTGRTFSAFVNEIRIGHACRLLLESARSVAEIAFASGFANLSNFNRRFRQLKGTSPLDYRRDYANCPARAAAGDAGC